MLKKYEPVGDSNNWNETKLFFLIENFVNLFGFYKPEKEENQFDFIYRNERRNFLVENLKIFDRFFKAENL